MVTFSRIGRFAWEWIRPTYSLPFFANTSISSFCSARLMAYYGDAVLPVESDRLRPLARTLHMKRIKMQGFFASDYRHRYREFFKQMSTWLKDGSVTFREDIVDGLENAPQAFVSLLEGKRFGKVVIRVTNDKPALTVGETTMNLPLEPYFSSAGEMLLDG